MGLPLESPHAATGKLTIAAVGSTLTFVQMFSHCLENMQGEYSCRKKKHQLHKRRLSKIPIIRAGVQGCYARVDSLLLGFSSPAFIYSAALPMLLVVAVLKIPSVQEMYRSEGTWNMLFIQQSSEHMCAQSTTFCLVCIVFRWTCLYSAVRRLRTCAQLIFAVNIGDANVNKSSICFRIERCSYFLIL